MSANSEYDGSQHEAAAQVGGEDVAQGRLHGHDSAGPAPEPDAPPTLRIFTVMGLLGLLVVVLLVGLWQIFKQLVRDEVQERELSVVSKDLIESRARDTERLTTFGLVDEKSGSYRMPIEDGMAKLLRQPSFVRGLAKVNGLVIPAPERPSAALPVAAPPGDSASPRSGPGLAPPAPAVPAGNASPR